MDLMHPTYLPFHQDVLREHFAQVRPTPRQVQEHAADPEVARTFADRHLQHYTKSIAANKDWLDSGAPKAKRNAIDIQIEKDERFWVVAALLGAYHSEDRVGVLTRLLDRAFRAVPPVAGVAPDGGDWTWPRLLGATEENPSGDAKLFFEANLPAPKDYKAWLSGHVGERVLGETLRATGTSAAGSNLEGTTKADAVLVVPSTGLCLVFEAKVNSDVSTGVRFDVLRNQIARGVDVMLEPPSTDEKSTTDRSLRARRPERSFLILLTPRIFQDNPRSRLYGHLLPLYQQQPELLALDLQHRKDVDWTAVANRLGWLTWEDCEDVLPGSLRWLPATGAAGASSSE